MKERIRSQHGSLLKIWFILPLLFSAHFSFTQCDCTATGLVNGDFEYGTGLGDLDFLGSPAGGWTSTYSFIEVWGSGFGGVPSHSGDNFLELNSGGPDILYQDISTCPGSEYNWSVAHRGRLGVDIAHLEFGPPGGPFMTVAVMSDGTTDWGVYMGSYTIPSGQTTTRIRFVSISYNGACPSCANFIDAFTFDAVDSDGDGTADCNDACPNDPNKTAPGQCGCGNADTDSDCDGIADCNDLCPGGDDSIDNNNDGKPDCKYPPAYANIIEDWKCGKNKVYVCHIPSGNPGNAHTICVSYNSLQAHISQHGDYLGPCGNANCGGGLKSSDKHSDFISGEEMEHDHADHFSGALEFLQISIQPNPNQGDFIVEFNMEIPSGDLIIYNILGQQVLFEKILTPIRSIKINNNQFNKKGKGLYRMFLQTKDHRLSQSFIVLD